MNNYKVYAHINKINGKVYIGITGQSLNQRWRNGNGYKYKSIIRNAINKYGWGNFHHVLLEDNLSKNEACSIEISLINYYKNQNISYNNSLGGEINSGHHFTLSEEAKKKISLAELGEKNHNYGKKFSLEHRKKISERLKGKWGYWKGKHLFQETKNKIKEAHIGKIHSEETKNKMKKARINIGVKILVNDDTFPYKINEAASKFKLSASHIRNKLKESDIIYIVSRESEISYTIKKYIA